EAGSRTCASRMAAWRRLPSARGDVKPRCAAGRGLPRPSRVAARRSRANSRRSPTCARAPPTACSQRRTCSRSSTSRRRSPPSTRACSHSRRAMAERGIKGGVRAVVPHDSATKHVAGEALYVDALPEPAGMLPAAVGLSTRAHAEIVRMDLEPVRTAPGVVAVVSARDVPGSNDVGPVYPGDPLFADGVVEYAGQALFAVAATTVEQ